MLELRDKLRFEWLWIRFCWKRRHNYFDKKKKTEIHFRYQLIMLGLPEIMQFTREQIVSAVIGFGEAFRNLGITAEQCNQSLINLAKSLPLLDSDEN